MAKKGALRASATPWQIVGIIGDLVTRLNSGYKVLKKSAVQPLEPPVYEQITVGTFVVGGIATSLSWIEEAVEALEEAAPPVRGIAKRYEAQFEEWRTFRDDAAHVVDRTLREPVKRRNVDDHDSAVTDPEYGRGTLVIGYDHTRDVLVTGTHELALDKAIETAGEIYDVASREVNEQTQLGNIARPTPPPASTPATP